MACWLVLARDHMQHTWSYMITDDHISFPGESFVEISVLGRGCKASPRCRRSWAVFSSDRVLIDLALAGPCWQHTLLQWVAGQKPTFHGKQGEGSQNLTTLHFVDIFTMFSSDVARNHPFQNNVYIFAAFWYLVPFDFLLCFPQSSKSFRFCKLFRVSGSAFLVATARTQRSLFCAMVPLTMAHGFQAL